MRKKIKKLHFLFFFVLFLAVNTNAIALNSQKNTKIIVFPFEVLSQKNLSFLGKGIAKMICTRLGDGNTEKIVIACKDKNFKDYEIDIDNINFKHFKDSKRFDKINFIVKGTITIIGSTINTDGELIDIKKGKTVYYFHKSSRNQEDIVQHASIFAKNIKKIVVKEEIVTKKDINTVSPKKIATRQKSIINQIPEKSILTSEKSQIQPKLFFKSKAFNTNFSSIAVADIDGDKSSDIVVIDAHNLILFSLKNGNLIKKGELEGKYYNTFKTIDAADINKNGKSEIFVTSIDRKNNVKSFVLEWENNGFTYIKKNSNWYYRIIEKNGQKTLLGQEGSFSGGFSGPVFYLYWDGTNYLKNDKIFIPNNSDLFSFTFGDILNTGFDQILWLDKDNHLNINKLNGNNEWKSSFSLGSSPFYIKSENNLNSLTRHYINGRIFVCDLNKDNYKEIIIAHNKDISKSFLKRFKKFTSGSIKSFTWKIANAKKDWETDPIQGYIADFAMADIDKDGKKELIYCTGIDSKKLIKEKKGFIIVEKF